MPATRGTLTCDNVTAGNFFKGNTQRISSNATSISGCKPYKTERKKPPSPLVAEKLEAREEGKRTYLR